MVIVMMMKMMIMMMMQDKVVTTLFLFPKKERGLKIDQVYPKAAHSLHSPFASVQPEKKTSKETRKNTKLSRRQMRANRPRGASAGPELAYSPERRHLCKAAPRRFPLNHRRTAKLKAHRAAKCGGIGLGRLLLGLSWLIALRGCTH